MERWEQHERRRLAYHEAGHALMARHLGYALRRVWIHIGEPDARHSHSGGQCETVPTSVPLTAEAVWHQVLMCAAGHVGESRLTEHLTIVYDEHDGTDYDLAQRWLVALLPAPWADDSVRCALRDTAWKQAHFVAIERLGLESPGPSRRALDALALALITAGDLDGQTVEAIIDEATMGAGATAAQPNWEELAALLPARSTRRRAPAPALPSLWQEV